MKITLIIAASKNDSLKKVESFMPISLPLLAATAPDHEYTFINMLSNDRIDYNRKVDIVGISYKITAEKTAYEIADKYKSKNVKVIFGGPQASCNPIEALKHADAVAVGEGEYLWPEILGDIEKNGLKQIYVCSPKKFTADKFKIHQVRSFVDLSKIQVPRRDIFRNHYLFDTVFASRGCPINCDFCSVPGLFGSKTRLRPVNDVVSEIDSLKKYYYLLDDTVFGRPENYKYYIDLYSRVSKLKKVKFWIGQANLDAASSPEGRKVIKNAAKAGLVVASIGMESINPAVLTNNRIINKIGIKKNENLIQRMKENIKFIQDQGIVVSGWFTLGYDEDSMETFYKTLEFCKETNIIPVFSQLEALPGTALYERLKKDKRINNTGYINIKHPVLKDIDILKTIKKITKMGYSFGLILKRTVFYLNKFDNDCSDFNRKMNNKIHKMFFTFFTQLNIKRGVITAANVDMIKK